MIPIRDENPTRRVPFVTIGLIAINVLVGVYSFVQPPAWYEGLINNFGAVPIRITRDWNMLPALPTEWLTLMTSMFLHGGWMHLAGNMLYLWIFGNNVEDHLGHIKFLFFYLFCGILAALTHYAGDITSQIPMVGASGAISGILGAYVILYPHARVVTMIWFFFYLRFVPIPAWVVLGVWFLMQLSGVLSAAEGGIAWWAHIGGFVAGLLIAVLLPRTKPHLKKFAY